MGKISRSSRKRGDRLRIAKQIGRDFFNSLVFRFRQNPKSLYLENAMEKCDELGFNFLVTKICKKEYKDLYSGKEWIPWLIPDKDEDGDFIFYQKYQEQPLATMAVRDCRDEFNPRKEKTRDEFAFCVEGVNEAYVEREKKMKEQLYNDESGLFDF